MEERFLTRGRAHRNGDVICMDLRSGIRVYVSKSQAVRVINPSSTIVLALSSSGTSAALIHPTGKLYQDGARVDMEMYDLDGSKKLVKFSIKGIAFRNATSPLGYLLDTGNTRITKRPFSDLSKDFSFDVFFSENPNKIFSNQFGHSDKFKNYRFWVSHNGAENWRVNDVWISEQLDGLTTINRNSRSLKISPTERVTISTSFLHCTASSGFNRHLFARCEDRRVYYDEKGLVVRNAGQSSGFDTLHQLKYN